MRQCDCSNGLRTVYDPHVYTFENATIVGIPTYRLLLNTAAQRGYPVVEVPEVLWVVLQGLNNALVDFSHAQKNPQIG